MTADQEIALAKELGELFNKHGLDNELQTQDFLLAQYVLSLLMVMGEVIRQRDLLRVGAA